MNATSNAQAAQQAAMQAAQVTPASINSSANTSPIMAAAGKANAELPKSSLYVGDLLPEVTEAVLFDTFNAIGSVVSIRVCRDAITRRSLGYAYVNYHSQADANRAIEQLNYSLIKNQPCRIMWSERDPAQRKAKGNNIFIKNLHKDIDNKTLYDTFSAFGPILSCKVTVNSDGTSRGFGFVHYETKEAADLAIEKVNGMMILEQQVFVGPFIGKKERDDALETVRANFTNVYVNNLPQEVDDDKKLMDMFSTFGEISSVSLAKEEDGKSKCFGFINFTDHDAAQKCVDEMNGKELGEDKEGSEKKVLFCGRAQKKSERERQLRDKFEAMRIEQASKYQGVNLFVKNIDDSVDEDRLRKEFESCGTIVSTKIMIDEKGNSRGFGFVCFSAPEEATKAVTELNGRILEKKPLYVGLAERKEVRKSKLEALHMNNMRMQQFSAAGLPQGAPGMFPTGAPVFYAPGMQQRGNMYPGMPQGIPGRPRGWNQAQVRGPGFAPQGMQPGNFSHMNPGVAQRGRGGRRPSQGPAQPMQAQAMARNPQQAGHFKLKSTARNTDIPAAPVQREGSDLTAAALAQAEPEAQKQMLGERLFPMIASTHPEQAGKITGMLLEMDNTELLHLLDSSEALESKVTEAIRVLEAHQQKQSQDNEAVTA